MRRTLLSILLPLLLTTALPNFAHAAHLTGKVVKIHNGDIIEVLVDEAPIRIHLYGIHCPEMEQTYGSEAKKYTTLLTYGKIVTVQITNRDRRGGITGKVMLSGERNLNCELLKAGLAWWNRQSAPDDRILKLLEESARENGIGLWSDPAPVPPWILRNAEEKHQPETREVSPHPETFSDDTTVYVTSSGEKYHKNGCRYLMKSMIPMRLGDARVSGLVPCPACDPPR